MTATKDIECGTDTSRILTSTGRPTPRWVRTDFDQRECSFVTRWSGHAVSLTSELIRLRQVRNSCGLTTSGFDWQVWHSSYERDQMVRTLVGQGKVEDARQAADSGSAWGRVLALPSAKPVPRRQSAPAEDSFAKNSTWVRDHRGDAEYRGKWVALRDGLPIAADSSRVELGRLLDELGDRGQVLVVRL